MAGMERFQTYKLICEGGLNSNQNYLLLSDRFPGAATSLINFESSQYGGYRRINGFTPWESAAAEVDATNAEGRIYGLAIFNDGVITARKQKSGATYKFYAWTDDAAWTAYTTGLSHVSTGVTKIRSVFYNFSGVDHIIFVDGVNNAVIYDQTNWNFIDSTDTGADMTHAGGNQCLDAPKLITTFKNHIFMSGDPNNPNIVAHSAPNSDYDWTVASGAGQLNVGFEVIQIKAFRDELFVFGNNQIKKIVVSGTDFVIQDVTSNGGCLASDSVIEVNGDLLFLAPDGIRTVAATDRIGDTSLDIQSKNIQKNLLNLISDANFDAVNALVIRGKSQVRYFFSDELLDVSKNEGIIGCLVPGENNLVWEWGTLRGIRCSSVATGFINNTEVILHGDYNGKVYQQEVGTDFDGENIRAVYTTPYLDFGDPFIRKTIHKLSVFIKPEGVVSLNVSLQFDWNYFDVFNPDTYVAETDDPNNVIISGGSGNAVYGTAVYGTSRYSAGAAPVLFKNVAGSGMSNRLVFITDDTGGCYSIQGLLYEYEVNGRK